MKSKNLLIVALATSAATASVCSRVAQADPLIAADRDFKAGQGEYAQTWVSVHLGDSMVAGYCGFGCQQPSYADYMTYLSPENSAMNYARVAIDGRIRAQSGFTASEIYLKTVLQHLDDVRAADIVTLDACGNDYLISRAPKENACVPTNEIAIQKCADGVANILDKVLEVGKPGVRVRVTNIHYPVVTKDRAKKVCDSESNFDRFLPSLVEGNWYTCEVARQRGIPCADTFALVNAADIDTNGDGIVDSEQLAWIPGESLESYKERILSHKDLIRDPEAKILADGSVVNIIGPDHLHLNALGHKLVGELHQKLGWDSTK